MGGPPPRPLPTDFRTSGATCCGCSTRWRSSAPSSAGCRSAGWWASGLASMPATDWSAWWSAPPRRRSEPPTAGRCGASRSGHTGWSHWSRPRRSAGSPRPTTRTTAAWCVACWPASPRRRRKATAAAAMHWPGPTCAASWTGSACPCWRLGRRRPGVHPRRPAGHRRRRAARPAPVAPGTPHRQHRIGSRLQRRAGALPRLTGRGRTGQRLAPGNRRHR